MNDVVKTVKNSSKVLSKGINALEKMVGKVVNLRQGVNTKISKSINGALTGITGSDLMQGIKSWSTNQLDALLEKMPDSVKTKVKAYRLDLDLACALTPIATLAPAPSRQFFNPFGGINVQAQSASCKRLSKNSRFRSDQLTAVKNENVNVSVISQRFPGKTFPENFDANHRIPLFIAKANPEAVREWMGRYGIEDINDLRIVDMMEASVNRSGHWREWKRVAEAKGRPLTADDIESILRDVEGQPTISNAVAFRAAGSI